MGFFLALIDLLMNLGEKMVLELCKNNGRPMFIGFGQSRALNETQAQVIELFNVLINAED
jgi:hypothetical protein